MTHSLLSRSVISLIALAPLALVSTASAGFMNRSASSGLLQINSPWTAYDYDYECGVNPHHGNEAFYNGTFATHTDSAEGVIDDNWAQSGNGFAIQTSRNYHWDDHTCTGSAVIFPKLVFNSWQEYGVSAWSQSSSYQTNAYGGHMWLNPSSWNVADLVLNFKSSFDDFILIETPKLGSFTASFQRHDQTTGSWTDCVATNGNPGTWSTLQLTNAFTVNSTDNYRFLFSGSGTDVWGDFGNYNSNTNIFNMSLASGNVPAPGALALLGMAGIFGGRRRR